MSINENKPKAMKPRRGSAHTKNSNKTEAELKAEAAAEIRTSSFYHEGSPLKERVAINPAPPRRHHRQAINPFSLPPKPVEKDSTER
ncbi:MAG: hypothetical protein FWC68_01895 [Oscillospiraceae bacterium]|nr:hypothetical protein [Oscillospiraceae bacterium]